MKLARIKLKEDIDAGQSISKGIVPLFYAFIISIGLYTMNSKFISSFALIASLFFIFKSLYLTLKDILILDTGGKYAEEASK